jgi:chromosome partitioning protein
MRTVVIASPKGGTGKSSIAAHLAVEAEQGGSGPVAVVDTDTQGSLADWWNAREAPTPQYAGVDIEQLKNQLGMLESHGVNLVIIDTPPALTHVIDATIHIADFVLVPVRPSPHDLRAVSLLIDMLEVANAPFCFVVNGATPRSIIALDAVRALAQHGKVAPSILHNRIDFATSMIDGRTVGELNHKSRSAGEVTELWQYVSTQLHKYVKGRSDG